MTWKALETLWKGLTELADVYKTDSEPFSTLIEARRIVEIEMREMGHEEKWRELAR